MNERRALVTGATGFIGSWLVPALVAQGWQVRACGRRSRPEWLPAQVDYRRLDLAYDDLGQLVGGISHVFHLAGASSSLSTVEDMHRSNVVATERLLDALAEKETSTLERLLYMSSTSIYGEEEPLPSPVREDVQPHPSRAYGKEKWQTEQLIWSAGRAGLAVVVLRPVSVYGPGNVKLLGSAVLDVAIERFAHERRILVAAQPVEQRLVHIDDLVAASLHLAGHPGAAGQAYNLVFPDYPTSHQVAELLADQLGMVTELSDDPECGLPYHERQSVRDVMLSRGMRPDLLLTKERFRFFGKANPNNRLSVDALLATGFAFADGQLSSGIARTITWYQDHHWIL